MNELIPINYEGEQPTVSARELYTGLEITDRFSRWFERMSAYGFSEGNDFTSVKSSTLVNNGAEREITDYRVSIDMAKQICMIQRSEKGRQYRQYFLDLEKAWNTPEQIFARALKMADQTIAKLKDSVRALSTEISVKNQIIGELKPKADYYDEILKNPGLVTITQISKDYGMSAKEMNSLLHDLGIQYKQSGQWLLYSTYHNMGYTHSETVNITRSDGRPDVKMNTKWTQKGRIFLYNTLKEKEILPVIEMLEETA
ncbi:phage antirepressor KilAC domain-containing protein [Ruminococcus sp. AF31-8BH]|uniref:phage antirepressor KilAC domain-containing protein n=1 Tax=Ruminococcus sp. AF31-8BH TaxID=2293174 RepID=UPI000E4D1588|nr:phage antirepressor KilAC domain-containing protein [Ruminococcus sp. AF31-8BH]RGF77015.1 phage antirepressor Ant [Ruminococcus sp. AF31-8BH]